MLLNRGSFCKKVFDLVVLLPACLQYFRCLCLQIPEMRLCSDVTISNLKVAFRVHFSRNAEGVFRSLFLFDSQLSEILSLFYRVPSL